MSLQCIGESKVKKLTFNIMLFILFILLSLVVIYLYIQPQQELDLKAEPIDVSEKMKQMVVNLKTEVVLTEDEIDSIIKMRLDPNINEHVEVEGAQFYIENDMLHAVFNVMYRNKIRAELNVQYNFILDEAAIIRLQPVSIKLKDVPLPLSLLKPMTIQLYNTEQSIVKITEVENKGRQLVIKWKINLF